MQPEPVEHSTPPTVQTTPVVMFSLDHAMYGLPLADVEQALPMAAPSPLPSCPDVVLGALNVHGRVVVVLDLRRRLGLEPRDYGPDARLLLARTPARTVALPVDEVIGIAEVRADQVFPPESVLPGIGHLEGIVALADRLLLISDLRSFLSIEEERQVADALGAAAG